MGQGYLADTNTIVDYLENKLPFRSLDIIDSIAIQLSIITRIELLVWQRTTDEQLQTLNEFINSSVVFPLDENVVIKTIEIRKKNRLKLPDAIIAATAIVNDLTLLTRNVSDFEKVSKIKYLNPYDL